MLKTASKASDGGSTATWAGTITEYDILGRVKRQSVPTEVNSSWAPTGDDTSYLWTVQKYDWMGRVVRKINTDGADSSTLNDSDVLISYAGCGCAGGLVTTIEGELVPRTDTSGDARRKQKSYADILGRTFKAETYEWDGTTVYSTVTSLFNGRDQVTQTRQYAGSDSSTTFQDTLATFDGHGRLKTSHRPEQRDEEDDPAFTTYNYNADDSILSVTDARGAVTNYEYNSRGLVEEMSWTVPGGSGIQVPTTVEFEYDNLGNRTIMTDGLGSVTYEYNELSQMTSETRVFSDTGTGLPNNTAALEYTYTLSGQLESYKLPFFSNLQVKYDFDKVGRLDAVSGVSSLGNFDYADNPHYRAWGALTHLDYGNGVEMNVSGFNNKLQATGFEVKKGTTQIIDKAYQYNSDGMVKFEDDNLNAKFDRAYEFDHQMRMTKAMTGAEARGQTDNPANIPYRTSYQYNAFGQRTQSAVNQYSQTLTTSLTFTNNRRTVGTQDAEGNLLYDVAYKYYKYDAANRLRHTDYEYAETESYTRQQEFHGYDGDGQIVKVETTVQDEENGPPVDGDTTYRIRSTVLSGQVVYENQMAYVFAGGDLLARQNVNGVMWSHKDPNMKSYRSTGSAGTVLGDGITNADWDKIESDPDGKSVGFTDPGVTNPTESNELYISGWSFGSMRNGQYNTHIVDGIHVPAEFLATRVGADRPGFGLDLLEFTAYQSTIQTGWRVRYRANDVTRTRDYSMSQYERVYDHWLEGAEIITPLFNNDWSPDAALLAAVQQREPRALNTDELTKLNTARGRALQALREIRQCREAIVAILNRVAGSALIPDQTLTMPDGTVINSPPLSNFVYNGSEGNSKLLNRYDSIPIFASQRSGVSGSSTTYGVANRRFRNDIHVETTITWNTEYFGLGRSARALHTLHEVLHDYASDVDIANAIAEISGDRSGPNNSIRTFADADQDAASIYINDYLRDRCNF